jgi:hypothetical protein
MRPVTTSLNSGYAAVTSMANNWTLCLFVDSFFRGAFISCYLVVTCHGEDPALLLLTQIWKGRQGRARERFECFVTLPSHLTKKPWAHLGLPRFRIIWANINRLVILNNEPSIIEEPRIPPSRHQQATSHENVRDALGCLFNLTPKFVIGWRAYLLPTLNLVWQQRHTMSWVSTLIWHVLHIGPYL